MEKYTSEWLFINNATDRVRYVIGEKGRNMVACVGINPSTAKPNALDNTLKSVKRISKFNGYDGWVMYNVYPQRATDPKQMDILINRDVQEENGRIISQSIQDLGIGTVWLAFGDLITSREFLPYCLAQLYSHLKPLDLKWKIIAEPTKKGHPKHPLYKPTESLFINFDMQDYITKIIIPRMF